MQGDGNRIQDLKAALEAARARIRAMVKEGAVLGPLDQLRAATEAALVCERDLGDAEGVETAHVCPWEVPWSAGAPCPVVVADGLAVHVAYYASERWQPPPNLPRPGDPGEVVGIATFRRCVAHRFGPPNDEALEGHPLYGRGLQMYGAHLVERSSWISELERRNRVHPFHKPEHYAKLKHYLLCFHDETFECIAEGHSIEVVEGVPSVLLSWLTSKRTQTT
jgi:hypothetical protein